MKTKLTTIIELIKFIRKTNKTIDEFIKENKYYYKLKDRSRKIKNNLKFICNPDKNYHMCYIAPYIIWDSMDHNKLYKELVTLCKSITSDNIYFRVVPIERTMNDDVKIHIEYNKYDSDDLCEENLKQISDNIYKHTHKSYILHNYIIIPSDTVKDKKSYKVKTYEYDFINNRYKTEDRCDVIYKPTASNYEIETEIYHGTFIPRIKYNSINFDKITTIPEKYQKELINVIIENDEPIFINIDENYPYMIKLLESEYGFKQVMRKDFLETHDFVMPKVDNYKRPSTITLAKNVDNKVNISINVNNNWINIKDDYRGEKINEKLKRYFKRNS